MNMDQSVWLDAKAAAAYIGRKSKSAHVYLLKQARHGLIKAGFNGRTWLFKPQDLDAFMVTNAKTAVRQ